MHPLNESLVQIVVTRAALDHELEEIQRVADERCDYHHLDERLADIGAWADETLCSLVTDLEPLMPLLALLGQAGLQPDEVVTLIHLVGRIDNEGSVRAAVDTFGDPARVRLLMERVRLHLHPTVLSADDDEDDPTEVAPPPR